MNAELVKAATEVVHNQQILVNIVSRRVRQLTLGHRPLVEFAPGMGHADIALTEIVNGKLIFESTFGQNGDTPPQVVPVPGITTGKKTKKAAYNIASLPAGEQYPRDEAKKLGTACGRLRVRTTGTQLRQ